MTDASSEVPEADALEQSLPVQASEPVSAMTADPEVPEADALEQSLPVQESDERDRSRGAGAQPDRGDG